MSVVEKLLAKVKRYPVRVRVYGVVLLALAYLVWQGHIEPVSAETLGTIVATQLGIKETERHTVPVIKASRKRRRRG